MTDDEKKEPVKVYVAPDLEYCYRDVCNVFIGPGDVILEFGNKHRAMPGNITIANRITLTTANAFALMKTLQQALDAAQQQLQERMKNKA